MKWLSNYEGVRRVEIRWLKSSFSGHPEADCLELASHEGDILLRESDDPGVFVTTTPAQLRAFLAYADFTLTTDKR